MCYYAIVREEVKELYNFECQLCYTVFERRKLQIHHILRKCDGGTNHHHNLIPFCSDCHIQVHSDGITHNSRGTRIMHLASNAYLRA